MVRQLKERRAYAGPPSAVLPNPPLPTPMTAVERGDCTKHQSRPSRSTRQSVAHAKEELKEEEIGMGLSIQQQLPSDASSSRSFSPVSPGNHRSPSHSGSGPTTNFPPQITTTLSTPSAPQDRQPSPAGTDLPVGISSSSIAFPRTDSNTSSSVSSACSPTSRSIEPSRLRPHPLGLTISTTSLPSVSRPLSSAGLLDDIVGRSTSPSNAPWTGKITQTKRISMQRGHSYGGTCAPASSSSGSDSRLSSSSSSLLSRSATLRADRPNSAGAGRIPEMLRNKLSTVVPRVRERQLSAPSRSSAVLTMTPTESEILHNMGADEWGVVDKNTSVGSRMRGQTEPSLSSSVDSILLSSTGMPHEPVTGVSTFGVLASNLDDLSLSSLQSRAQSSSYSTATLPVPMTYQFETRPLSPSSQPSSFSSRPSDASYPSSAASLAESYAQHRQQHHSHPNTHIHSLSTSPIPASSLTPSTYPLAASPSYYYQASTLR